MSDSESSEDFGVVAENHNTDESEDTTESVSDGSSEADCLFDLEASDVEDEPSDRSEEGSIDWSFGLFPEGHDSFPQFMKLPIELRFRVWEFFCPDLTGNCRVLDFEYCENKRSTWIEDSLFLDQVTVRARAVLSVHQESRQFAIRAFPDTLTFGADRTSVVRFNAYKDIISLRSPYSQSQDNARRIRRSLHWDTSFPSCPGFTEHVRIVCVEPSDLAYPYYAFEHFSNLITVYVNTLPTFNNPKLISWCTSDRIKRYSFNHFWKDEVGNGCFTQRLYCWPDISNPRAFFETHDLLREFLDASQDAIGTDLGKYDFGGFIWPLVLFEDSGIEFLEHLKTWDGKEDLGKYVAMEPDRLDDPGEYESEGIDDSDISEDYYSESDSFLASEDDDRSDDSIEPSSPRDLDGSFSSEQPSSEDDAARGVSDATESGSDSQGTLRATTKRRRARLIVPDSDDDSDDDIQPRKRARIVNSDDTSSESDRTNNASGGDRAEEEWSGISDSEEESEQPETEGKYRPMSLAEKLQLHRQNNPIPSTDDESSGSDEDDEPDTRYHVHFDDDDEGSRVSGEEGYDDQYGHMEDDDEDEEDDY
ncbi:hypothetical protein VTJ83DRAFT_9 [Remersonia thermophila]|uniref:2EXR domain-containing protein n=1 Tax=Remersonia thermophila TaxID=72144 RepID=A0ABR4DJU9_9PEZI